MSYLVDRRENAKHKSMVNRRRFMDRYKKHIKKAVNDAVDARSIRDVERGEAVVIPADDVSEPTFGHGQGGRRTVVHPGNKEFVAGDRIPRPAGGGQGGGSDASNSGEGQDDFVFQLSSDEFMEVLFDDLALPNLTKEHLKGEASFKYQHAGFVSDGVPAKLSVARTMRSAKARRVALGKLRAKREREAIVEALLAAQHSGDELTLRRLGLALEDVDRRIRRIPFLDDRDLRYNLHIKQPQPTSQAVMFCVMDVSGSMDQGTKDIAKRFFLLLYLFLQRHYQRTEVVFIRHHTQAKEVDEQEFFYSKETGGTVVSSALRLMQEIIEERYSPDEWNIYGAQASDGDNWSDDSPTCAQLLSKSILPGCQHYSYIEITKRKHQALWRAYADLQDAQPDTFAMQHIIEASDIWPVFRALFKRREAA